MAKRDFYEILGVGKGADETALKAAYRKLAKQFHPDINKDPGAEQKFKEASEAYEILKDPQKRAAYDQFGHAAFQGGMGAGAGAGFGGFDSSAFSDIFEDLFGEFTGRGRRSGQSGAGRGQDKRYNLSITLEEAFKGKTANVRVPTAVSCERCTGSGAEPGSKPETCPMCRGQGRVRASQGFFTIERTCPQCHGRGQAIKDPCKDCRGGGRVEKERTLAVNIPAGVEDGSRIRLSGEGDGGIRGGPAGDLYIFLSVEHHPLFERDGPNLHCHIPVSMVTAALGGQVEVPTLSGERARITLPEGTQGGRQFRLRGKGMPVLRTTTHGDLIVEVRVETPVNLTRKQKDLLKQFQEASSDKTNPETQGFIERVRQMWDDLKE